MSLKLATYNVHKLVGSDGKWNEARVLNVIRAMDADILAIQEFVVATDQPAASSPTAFAAAAGYHVISQPLMRPHGMIQHNLLLTREPAKDVALIELPRDGREPRGVILADMDTENGSLSVAATHLGLTPQTRQRQLAQIFMECGKRNAECVALLGDLNTVFPWEGAARLLRRAFPGQKHPHGFPAKWPFLRLDAIHLRPANIMALRAFTEAGAHAASDHLPLIADVVFSRAG
ncbi:MAG: hypothetical protein RJB62_1529 [Pseudomonadota bacterium]|jgi:endonuclease/exonuclease/phosphatase family metal-dependent hydrolase